MFHISKGRILKAKDAGELVEEFVFYRDKQKRQHILLLIGLPINILCHWEYIPSGLLHHKYDAWSSSQYSSQWKQWKDSVRNQRPLKVFQGLATTEDE